MGSEAVRHSGLTFLSPKQVYGRQKKVRQNSRFTLVMLTVGNEIPNK
jgi:hypothetical protein